MVSELLYAGKNLAEIAGYDDLQMVWVVCRRRDNQGALVRSSNGLPPGVEVDAQGMRTISRPVPFGNMFAAVCRGQGNDRESTQRRWEDYLEANPKLDG